MSNKVKKINPRTYGLETRDATVKIGGSMPDKFEPIIHSSRWGGACFLEIKPTDFITSEKEEFKEDKLSLKVGNNTHRYYSLENEDIEYEIEYPSRPPYDVETFDLSFPDGVIFAKQLPLEEEWKRDSMGMSLSEYLIRVDRPDNAVNSYAVYWGKQDNQYKAGKFCHIPRAFLIDANGDHFWCDMDINPISKKWKIIMDGVWLDNAVYPVILGPTLGYDTVGASAFGTNVTYNGRVYQTDATGGNIQSFHCAVATISGSPGVKMAVSEVDQGTGDPSGKNIVEQIELIPSSPNSTVNIDAVSKNLLSPSTRYSILWISDSASTDVRFDSGLPSITRNTLGGRTYAAAFEDPLPSGFLLGSVTSRFSTWIVYEPSAVAAGGQIINRGMAGAQLINGGIISV